MIPFHVHSELVTIPEDNPTRNYILAFSHGASSIQLQAKLWGHISRIIGGVCSQALLYNAVLLRRALVERALSSRDLNSFVFRSLSVAAKALPCDAGSIYLVDEKASLIRLHATTGVKSDF